MSYAVRAEIIPNNKLLGPHRLFLRDERKQPRILEVGEVSVLLNVVSDLRQKSAISLAYYYGLRRREISNLRWEDIDFDQLRMDIVDRPDAHTKTRRSRSIALREETAALLKQLYRDRVNEHVFVDPSAFYWRCDKWFKKLVEAADIDYCTLHDLRKTCNTLMKDAGISPEAALGIQRLQSTRPTTLAL